MTYLPRLLCIALLIATPAFAGTIANDDSCDISIAPAATLLLPYFEVADDRLGETTLFTVTNVTSKFQVGRVTLWTDFAYPVVSFDLLFEPYELRRINLHDVIWRGVLDATNENDICGARELSESAAARAQTAFTEGRVSAVPGGSQPGCNNVGHVHENAVGYATIDVVGTCASGTTPLDARHFAEDLRFDNVFIGDYQQVNSGQDFAQGNPMVHIRAMPEGGTPQSRRALPNRYKNNFPYTFYGRFQDPAHPTADARQPLPRQFAMRWINGGIGSFETSFKIWREGVTGIDATCADYPDNGELEVAESVVFDEDENGEGVFIEYCGFPICGFDAIVLPATSLTSIADSDIFPQDIINMEIGGWVYLNLDTGWQYPYGAWPSLQNWVVVSMRAEGRYSVDFDAATLGNGCTPVQHITEFSDGGTVDVLPGPAPDYVP